MISGFKLRRERTRARCVRNRVTHGKRHSSYRLSHATHTPARARVSVIDTRNMYILWKYFEVYKRERERERERARARERAREPVCVCK